MTNAEQLFDQQARDTVEAAVTAAEQRTAAEIVCAAATESGRYDRAEAIGGLFAALLFLCLAQGLHWLLAGGPGNWQPLPPLGLGWQCVAVALGFLAGQVLCSYVHPLRRLLTSRRELEEESWRAAQYLFASRGLHRTKDHGGLLIYLSLFERRVIVLADDRARKALGDDAIGQLRDDAIARLCRRDYTGCFTATVQDAAGKLAEVLPIQPDDEDELPNHFLVFHPRP